MFFLKNIFGIYFILNFLVYESVPKTNTVSIMAAVTIIFFVVYQIFSQLLIV